MGAPTVAASDKKSWSHDDMEDSAALNIQGKIRLWALMHWESRTRGHQRVSMILYLHGLNLKCSPKPQVFVDGAFGRCLGHEYVILIIGLVP